MYYITYYINVKEFLEQIEFNRLEMRWQMQKMQFQSFRTSRHIFHAFHSFVNLHKWKFIHHNTFDQIEASKKKKNCFDWWNHGCLCFTKITNYTTDSFTKKVDLYLLKNSNENHAYIIQYLVSNLSICIFKLMK